MTLADLTALYSKVLRERPELQGDRNVDLFIQDCIEELRNRPTPPSPKAPVDYDTH